MAIDRRVVRTRTALYDALVALVRRKDYEQITVQDILNEANVGRATFYAHFTSKDELLKRSLERLRDLLRVALGEGGRAPFPWDHSWSPSRVLFEHLREFDDVRFALGKGRGGPVLRDAVDGVLAGVLRAAMPSKVDGAVPRELAILHIVSTIHTTVRWWQEHRRDLTAADVDILFMELVSKGLPKAAFGFFIAPRTSEPARLARVPAADSTAKPAPDRRQKYGRNKSAV
jgi:AcrR family transcriptional regulator